MMRQHATPLLIDADGGRATTLTPLAMGVGGHGISELAIQTLVQAFPSCLPIAEIDPLFCGPVPICTELNTPAGPIDNFMVTASGLPVLVECKLWRNPEGRREVVGQILDYAKELSRWSSSDLQREVSRRLKCDGNALLDLVRDAGHEVEEIAFNDALTLNLRRGRFLLLIVGDGIREGVEAIAEYLQSHAGLHFTLGLVEMPIYQDGAGQRLVVPRVLARTHLIERQVIAVPMGHVVDDSAIDGETVDDDAAMLGAERQAFWTEFLSGLELDDPEQPIPPPYKLGYLAFALPARGGSAWLNVFRNLRTGEVGVQLSSSRNSQGDRAVRLIAEDWEAVRAELGGTVQLIERDDRPCLIDRLRAGALDNPVNRDKAFLWLRKRTNDFINVLRPRVRTAVADMKD